MSIKDALCSQIQEIYTGQRNTGLCLNIFGSWEDMWLTVFIRNRLPTFLWPVWVAALPWNTTAPENSRLNRGKSIREQKYTQRETRWYVFAQPHRVLGKSRTGAENEGLTMVRVKARLFHPHEARQFGMSSVQISGYLQKLRGFKPTCLLLLTWPHDQVIQLTESQFLHPQNRVIKPYITKVVIRAMRSWQ